jgi:nitrate/nitrite transport system substrate-binding protein
VIESYAAKGKPFKMGMVFPVSTHNYELRYWLAAGGIIRATTGATTPRVRSRPRCYLSVTPPPQMPATLEAGTINGYCVGEPWNQAGGVQGHRRAGDHRLRDLEEQPGKGLRRHRLASPMRIPTPPSP